MKELNELVINESLKLRDFKTGDAESLTKLANNKKIWRWVRDRFPHPYRLEDAKAYIFESINSRKEFVRVIEFEGNFVGVISLVRQEDIYRYCAELGYWIGEPYWNMGFATSAVRGMLEVGFKMYGMERIYAFIMEGNESSQRVLEKAELTYEGVRRKAAYKDDQFHDEMQFSILREEYDVSIQR